MRRSERVMAIRGVAKSHERELASVLARARGDVETEESKLRCLQRYLDEYRTSGSVRSVVTKPAILRERRGFLTRLDDAVRQQKQQVAAARARADDLAARWRESRTHLDALGKAADRLRAEDDRRDARSEQAATDETSVNMISFSRR